MNRRRATAASLLTAVLVAPQLPAAAFDGTAATAPASSPGRIERIALTERSQAPTVGPEGQEVASAVLEAQDFNVAGVTWNGMEEAHLTSWMRVRTDAGWTRWIEVHDDHHMPDPEDGRDARSGTEPFVTEAADAIEVRVVSESAEKLPEDLQLELIDPGTAPSDTEVAQLDAETDAPRALEELPDGGTGDEKRAPDETSSPEPDSSEDALPEQSEKPAPEKGEEPVPKQSEDAGDGADDGSANPSPTPAPEPESEPSMSVENAVWSPEAQVAVAQPASVRTALPKSLVPPKPTIRSRASWGADETIRRNYGKPIQYGEVRGAFVHHTAGTNSYSRSDVPRLIRGIYRYHVQSRNFYDIGYNFLVDRFGRIWEGAYGGVDKAVVGAHTQYYNSYSFAMSAMGDYTSKNPENAVLNAYKDLIAWKFGVHGVRSPMSTATYTYRDTSNQPTIAAHRDTKSTACPGQRLYNKLSNIRSGTKARMQHADADLEIEAPESVRFGQWARLHISWEVNGIPVSGKVNVQRLKNGRWTHESQVTVTNGKGYSVRTPGRTATYRLRPSSYVTDPYNVDTSHPKGTSNQVTVEVRKDASLPVLTLSGPNVRNFGERTEMDVVWTSQGRPVTSRVNLQRLDGSRWVHMKQFAVTNGRGSTVIWPGGSNTYRLRPSPSASISPWNVVTKHPQGTSNRYSITLRNK